MSTPPESNGMGNSTMKKDMISRASQVISGVLVIGIILFLAAGRLDWTMGWVYVGLHFLGLIINLVFLLNKNPEVIAARAQLPSEETPMFDKIFTVVYTLSLIGIMVISGIDAGRYGWSTVPTWVQILSIVLFIASWLFSLWAMVENKYFETTVRIQVERGHETISSGPYGIMRHPGYASYIIMFSASATLLGSWWGLIPAGILAIGFVMRTAREDQTLQEKLPGYAAYAEKVRYRLYPGVW